MAGEGCAFLHAPPGFGAAAADHRLVRRVRGSEPAAGQRRLRQGRDAASSARPSIPRRSTASTPCGGCSRRMASPPRAFRRMSRRCSGSCSIASPALRSATPSCSTRSTARPHARFLAFRSPNAQRWYAELKAQNCITDVRGDVLRIGFGIYQDEGDVDRLVELLGGACSDRIATTARRSALARPRAAAARLHLQLSRPADPRHPRRPDHRRPPSHRHRSSACSAARPSRSSIRCSAFRSPSSPTAPAAAGSIAAALAFWSAFTGSVRHGHDLLAAVRLPHGRRHRRGRRRRAVLCADRRLFRAAAPRAGAGDLLARRSDRPCRSGR